jgi:flagellar biosynthetic protein FliQ
MSEAEVFEVLRAHMWAAVLMGLPILGVALVVGFVIGLLQALTSIQEMTLTFIPKVLAVIVVLFLSLGYMTRICLDLFNNWVLPIIAG